MKVPRSKEQRSKIKIRLLLSFDNAKPSLKPSTKHDVCFTASTVVDTSNLQESLRPREPKDSDSARSIESLPQNPATMVTHRLKTLCCMGAWVATETRNLEKQARLTALVASALTAGFNRTGSPDPGNAKRPHRELLVRHTILERVESLPE